MKKILVPTDFSKNAGNAFNFATEIAKKSGAEIFLVHAFRVPSHSGVLLSMEKEFEESNLAEMKAWISRTAPNLNPKLVINKRVVMGSANAIIPSMCKSLGIELIIMGTQGATGLEEVFLGSNTVGLIKKTDVAVWAIPEGFDFRPPKTIVLAVDEYAVSSEKILQPLLKLMNMYNSKLKIVHVKPEGSSIPKGGLKQNFASLFSEFEYEFLQLESSNVSDVIQRYTTSVKAELLCMISRKRHWLFDRMFKSSVAYKTAFHTNLPFLVLSDPE